MKRRDFLWTVVAGAGAGTVLLVGCTDPRQGVDLTALLPENAALLGAALAEATFAVLRAPSY